MKLVGGLLPKLLILCALLIFVGCNAKKSGGVVTGNTAPPVPVSSITATGPVPADGTTAANVVIRLYDNEGNPITSTIPTFTATDTDNTNSYGACATTATPGRFNCTFTSTRAELKHLQITSPQNLQGGTLLFVAGDADPASTSITGSEPVSADGVNVSFIAITMKDVYQNPLVGTVPSFMATNTGGTNTYGACAPSTPAGVSLCTLASLVAETKTLQLVSPVSVVGDTVLFEPGAPVPATSTIFASGPVAANGVAVSIVTITLRDAGWNPVPAVVPEFTATDTDSANVYTDCSLSDSAGVSICTLKSTRAETKTLTITAPITKVGGTVVFQSGAPVAANSSITGTTPVTADGVSTSTISVSLRDVFNNPVPGQVPSFTATGTNNTIGACGTSSALGVSTCTLRSTKAESKVLSIATPFVKAGSTVVFQSGLPSVANSTITGTGPVLADGVATSTVTITLNDASMNPVVGTTPTFTATNTGTTNVYNSCSVSNASGVSTCTLTSTKAELKTLSIATPIVKADGTVLFEAGAPVAATSTIVGTSPVVANGSATSSVTIVLRDAFSNPVPGQTPTFSATDTSSTNVYTSCSATDTNGSATCTMSSTKAESKTLAIVSPVAKSDGVVVFQAGTAFAANSNITGTGPVVADGVATSTVTISLKDQFNNPLIGTTPTFGATDTNTTNTYGVCDATDTNGDSTCTLASLYAETKTLAITAPTAKTGGTVVFTPGAAVPANSTISGSSPVVADGVATSSVTITLRDAANNPVAGQTPTFSATDTGTTNTYGSCSVSNASGVSTCTLASLKAEVKTLSIATPVVKADGTVTFTPGPAAIATSTITGTGPVVADDTATSTVTITLKDANNNPVVGTVPTFGATDPGTTNTYSACSATDANGVSTCTMKSTKAEVKTLSIATPIVKADGTVTFEAGAASSTTTTIAGTSPVIANGLATSTITITIRDIYSNPRAGDTPIFNATDTGMTNVYGACSVSSASGVSTCTVSSFKAEVKTLQLTSPTAVTGGTVTFEADAASPANSSISGTGPVIANGSATSSVTITLKDANNNPVVGTVPTFGATDTGTTNAYDTCSATDASGVSNCTFTSTRAETKTLAIVSPIAKSDGTVVFEAGAPVAATSTITGTGPTVADGSATSTITVTLRDAFSNPVAGQAPTFTATDTDGSNVYGACGVSNASGVSTCTLASLKAETKTLVISAPVVKVGGTVVFSAGAPVAANSSITGTGPTIADNVATSSVTITLRDINNNTVAGVIPTFGATDTGSTNGYGPCSATDANGVSSCTLKSTKAETKTLSILTPVSKADGTVEFTSAGASVANSTITGTGPVVADGSATSAVTVTLKDAFDNPVSGTTPTFSATDTGTTNTYGTCSATDANGESSCTLASTKAETKTLSIATPVVKADGTVVFTSGTPAAATSTISGTGPTVADGVTTSTVTVTIRDAFSNPVAGQSPTFSATDTGGTNVTTSCGTTNASGATTCTLASTKAETKTLSIVSPVTKTGGTVVFVAGSPVAANSSISGTGPVVANGSATSSVTVSLKDAFNNEVSGVVPTFSATDTGTTNVYTACSSTDTSGLSTCTLASLYAETKTLSIVTPVSKSDGSVVFTAGAPVAANSTITGTGPVIADGTATSTVTITLKDAQNNPVAGSTPTFGATDTGTTNAYGSCSSSNASGVSTCTFTSTKAEVKTLSIATPVSKADGTVTFLAGGVATTYTTITGTGPVVADGSSTSTVTVTLKDAFDNAVAGETPTFSATDTSATNAYGACSVSNASGVSTCTLASTKMETKTLALATPVVKTGGTVVFTAGAAVAANSTITGTGPVVANGAATSTVTITLKDAYNNEVSGTVPTFTATDTGTANTYGACSSSNASGVSTCTLASTAAETKTLAIATPVAKADGTVVFTAGAPDAANSIITGTGPVVADGTATSTVTITLKDASNNPVSGTTPTFSATDTGSVNSYGSCSATDASGVSTCTFSSTKAEVKTLSIATPIVKADGTVTFTAGAIVATTSTITGTGPVVANGSSTSTVTITLRDTNSNPVSGTVPTFSATDTGTTNTYGTCSSSDASGISTCTLASTKMETKTLSIATPVTKAGGTVVFTAGAAVAANSTITGTGPVLANGVATSTVTITLKDAHNNEVSGTVPTFTATNTGTTNTYGTCSSTNASGVSTCTLASTTAETKTLSIATPVVKADGTVVFQAAAPVAANSTITGTGPVTANGSATSTVTITLKDASNNAVAGVVPTFSATDTGSTNTYGTCSSTNASGISTCTLASTKAETKTLSIATPVSKADGTVVFQAGAVAATNTTITGTGPVTADGTSSSTVTITLLDAYNNPVSTTVPTFNATDTGTTNVYGTCSAANASGVSTCTLKSTKAEVKTLALLTPVAKSGGTVTFNAGAAVAANSTITGTGPVVANGSATSTVTITLMDAFNNNVSGTVPTFSATNTSTTNTYGTCSSSNASGVSTCTLASTYAETKTLSIATPVSKADGTVVFTPGGAVAANSTITGTGPVVANNTATSTITITLKDANNNNVVGEVPTFGATDTGSGNTYTVCSATDSSGVSTCTLKSTKAEVKTLSITAPITKSGGTVTFTAGAASSTTTTIAGTTPVTANGVATSFITITILDAYSNPITGTTPIFNATNTGTTNVYGACSASSASGVSSCTLSSTKAESKILQLTSPTAVTGGTVVFQAGAAVAANSTITGTGPVLANNTATSTIIITLKDANNNPVPGQTPTFDATNTGSGNTYGSCTMGDTSGVSSCTLKSTKAETKTLNITAPVTKSGGTVVFEAGAVDATNSTITGTGPVIADGATDSTITITLKDAAGNPVAGQTPEFDANGTGNSYDDCTVGNASGVSTCYMQSTVAEVKTLQLTVPVTKTGGTVTFTAGAASASTTTIVGTTPVVADNTAVSTVTITVRDAQSNPISGTTPTFTTTGTGNTQTACSATNATGVSTCTVKSTKAEVKTIALATPVSKTGNAITFTAGAAVAANSTITGTGPIAADGTSTSTITITLKDTNNNLVAGQTPTFTATGTGNTLGSCSVTNASGVSTCTLASVVAGTKTLAIATPVSKTDGTVVFQSGGAVAANSTITGTGPVVANGSSTSTVTIMLKDITNNAVVGVVPTFSATDTGTTNVNGTCSASNASGVSTCTLASTKAEVKTLSIATPVVKAGGTVTFNPGAVSAVTSTIDGTSPTLANGTDVSGITITLLDAFNNPISGTVPTFTATGTSNTVGACSSSNASGVSSCTLRSTKAEGKTIALATPVAVAGATLDFNPNGIDIQVPIEMIDRGIIAGTSAVTFDRSRTSLNTDDYVAANNTYYFEIVAHNLSTTTAGVINLVDGAGNVLSDTTITVPVNTSAANMTRYRVEFNPNDGADTYRVRTAAASAASTVYVHSARIIVEQDNATDTRIYIPLMGIDNTSDNASDTSGSVLSTTATTATTSASYMSYWTRDDSQYDTYAPNNAWTFEAVGSSNNAAGTTTISLFNRTTTQQVAQVVHTGTTRSLQSASFATNATNFVNGNAYDVRYRSSSTSYTARVFKAGLWVKLKYLKKTEIRQRLSMRRSTTTATTNYFDNRSLWEAGRWSNPSVFFETVGYVTTSTIGLYSVSNTDSGSATMTAVTNGTITPDSAQSVKRSAALTLVDGDRYFVRHTRSGGTAVMVGAFLIIRATE